MMVRHPFRRSAPCRSVLVPPRRDPVPFPRFFFAWVWCSVMPRILDSRPDRTGVPPHSLLVCVLAAWILFFTMESLILAQDERWLQA